MTSCFKNWVLNVEVANIKSLAIIVLWFIWRARNLSCFEDISLSSAQVSCYSLGMLRNLLQKHSVVASRNIFVEDVDRTYAWGFFDGSAVEDPHICGAGGMLYLSVDHFFTFKAGLGMGTINFAELYALKLLLTLAQRNSLDKIQIFGDS